MSNLDKLKRIWLNLENTYAASGMKSKRDFLMKYLGYRDGNSGLSKLLAMLQSACEFNNDHEPLPEYKADYEMLTRILNNADKVVQLNMDVEGMYLDSLGDFTFEIQEQHDILPPSFVKEVCSMDIVGAIISRFAGNYYNVGTQQHMVLASINDNAALIQLKFDYQRILTYLVAKVSAGDPSAFDQILFRYLIKNNISQQKFPVNIIFLDDGVFDIVEDNMVLHTNGCKLNDSDVKSVKRSKDRLVYQGVPYELPPYTIYKAKNKTFFGKVYSIYGFKVNE